MRRTLPEFSTRVSSGTMVGMLKTTIDLSAIAHNVRLIKEKVGPEVKLMCVVKADAYGHGAAKVVPVMARAGAD